MTGDAAVGAQAGPATEGTLPPRALVPATPARRPAWPEEDRHRRPSGKDRIRSHRPPPGTWAWTAALVVAVVLLALGGGWARALAGLDQAVRDFLAPLGRPPEWATDLGRIGAVLGYRVLWIPTVLVLVWTARWRHVLVYVGSIWLMAAIAQVVAGDAALVPDAWEGVIGSEVSISLPAWPVIVLATVATGSLFVLTPSGRVRRWGWLVVVGLAGGLATVRVALLLDTAADAVLSAVVGCAASALAFRVLAPEHAFPVTYRRQVKAHLRFHPARVERIRAAVRDQLGIELDEIRPYHLGGSAGSTPCRLRLAHGPPEDLFGKLYATTHLRSDRWYKWARVLRYGRLEDEAPFSSVRRLVEHEDYMLRLLRDGGVRVPEPVGVVEVVPGREYLLVTELVPDAVEVLDSGMDDAVVDDALRQVRRLWATGAAHRDVKPSNVLARGDRVYLVDVSFGELRPSRWRQAVDLANMVLTLALAAGPRRVVERAQAFFTPEELAEALAATSSLTIPRQLGRRLADADGDLVEDLRALLPPHPPIRVQRWSMRRVLLAAATLGGTVLAMLLLALNLRAGGLL
ncbi:RIO1 family protein [Geodermatophilus obscurus]|uniref:non-specific serine/threonine protein kinase n=1 Tax=Geodermatophilus obscurus TaxID=1861 RepID=A0A1M7UZI3_9ACTN|nr:RIO1 family regulatory kinase/ATPase [Geodermatophilus obscurus]SHN88441.1 RIO1 family protein [Geodermatophilus obscurus]